MAGSSGVAVAFRGEEPDPADVEQRSLRQIRNEIGVAQSMLIECSPIRTEYVRSRILARLFDLETEVLHRLAQRSMSMGNGNAP